MATFRIGDDEPTQQNAEHPLGLVPDYIWKEQIIDIHALERIDDIRKAVYRFMDARIEVPANWITEYNELVKRAERIEKAQQKQAK